MKFWKFNNNWKFGDENETISIYDILIINYFLQAANEHYDDY